MLRRTAQRKVKLPPCDFKPDKYTGPSKAAVAALRAKYVIPAHLTYYPTSGPLMVVQGHRQWIFDETGDRYLDMFGGVTTVSVGHSHPRITEAVNKQARLINHTTVLYLHPAVCEFSETFAKKLPKRPDGDDWVVNVVSSGSEANDYAMLMCRVATGNYHYATVRNGYHGFTEGSRGMITVPGWKHKVPPPPGLVRLACPHPYRGTMGTTDPAPYLADAADVFRSECPNAVAGVVVERIQGVGGTVPLIDGYNKGLADLVHANGGYYVSDEVQCGFGRLGTHYWGFEHAGVMPDIVTTAKSVANGWSVGVVAARRSIADKMKGVAYFNTFGGSAINSLVANETMKIIDEEGLQANSLKVGKVLKDGLKSLQSRYKEIGDVRGHGLLVGMEMVKKDGDKVPCADTALKIMEGLKAHKILVGKGGPAGNVVRLHPPLCITEADAAVTCEAVEAVLKTL